MMMETTKFILVIAASIVCVYVLVWVGATAWFQARRTHTKQVLKEMEKD